MSTAVVVGSGPNGLVAALVLARAGWDVTVLEAQVTPGGGTRTEQLTLPGVLHDVCSAIHPLAVASPAFTELDAGSGALADHGLEWIHPDVPLAHPLDGGRAAILTRDLDETARGFGRDAAAYSRLFRSFVETGSHLTEALLSPLTIPPRHPITLARYAVLGVRSAAGVAARRFDTDEAKTIFAGLSGHSMLPLSHPASAGYGLLLGVLGHTVGWPMARRGSQRIADALVTMLEQAGGRIECGHEVTSLSGLPPTDAVLLDVTPRQFLAIAGGAVPDRYRRALARFRHGPGVFKLDWALDGPIPWSHPDCARAGTVHVGGTIAEIADGESTVHSGGHPERPFVLLAQQTLFDPDRAPSGTHTAWAYCHVPNGSTIDMTQRIEAQVERFAPGFKDRIVARHAMDTAAVVGHDANYIGGDISGGVADLRQFLARPTVGLHPWRTPVRGVYLCSSSTPPGAGVHGMCGWHAARQLLHDHR